MVRKPPAAQESQVWSLGGEDPWRRKWQHTPVFLPGEFHGEKSLGGLQKRHFLWSEIELPDDPTIILLSSFLRARKTSVHGSLYTKAESSVIHESPKVETPQCSLADEWINRKYCVQKMEHRLATEWDDVLAYYSMTTLKTQRSVREARHRWPRTVELFFQWNVPDRQILEKDSKFRPLLLGRKGLTSLDNVFQSRDITLPTKVHLVKAMVFPIVMNGYKSWTVKKAKHWRIDACKLCVGEDSWESLGLPGDPSSPS